MPETGSILVSEPPSSLLTQTVPSATAMPLGPSPTGIVLCGLFVAGSMCVTVLSRLFATQTPPAPVATAPAPLPAWIGMRLPDFGSTLVTVPPAWFVTQTEP